MTRFGLFVTLFRLVSSSSKGQVPPPPGGDDRPKLGTTECENCETWQHNVCYFYCLGLDAPPEGAHFLCVDCGPSHPVDPKRAAVSMRKKLQKLSRIADRINELRCEIMVREEEIEELEIELACVESEWYTKGPFLVEHDSPAAWELLDELELEHHLINLEIARTLKERDDIEARVKELTRDDEHVRLNEQTEREALLEYEASLGMESTPLSTLFTDVGSLGSRSCRPEERPQALLDKLAEAEAIANGKGKKRPAKSSKIIKRPKKRARR